jgi:hypothetical protein
MVRSQTHVAASLRKIVERPQGLPYFALLASGLIRSHLINGCPHEARPTAPWIGLHYVTNCDLAPG